MDIGAKYFTVGRVEQKRRLKQKQEGKDRDKERAEDVALTEEHLVNHFLNCPADYCVVLREP